MSEPFELYKYNGCLHGVTWVTNTSSIVLVVQLHHTISYATQSSQFTLIYKPSAFQYNGTSMRVTSFHILLYVYHDYCIETKLAKYRNSINM